MDRRLGHVIDPTCRFAVRDDFHVCMDRDGNQLAGTKVCWAESRTQISDAAEIKRLVGPADFEQLEREADEAIGDDWVERCRDFDVEHSPSFLESTS